MKKLLCLFLLVGLLTGCHKQKESVAFEVPETFDTDKTYEVVFWAKNDTNKTQINIYRETIKDFERVYPNISVTMKLYTNYGDIYNDVITNISTNTTPNVCITYPDHIATYKTGENVVVPLDDLMLDEHYGFGGDDILYDSVTKEEMIEQYVEEGFINDAYYAIPFMRSSEVCYINKTYVEKLGYEVPDILSWDYLWEVSEAAMAKNADGTFKVNNQSVLIPFIYKSTDNMMIQYLRQMGAGYSDDSGNITLFNEVTADFLKTIGSHAKSRAFSTFKISSYPANFLNAGQCIFAIDSTAGSTWMGTNAPLCDIAKDKIVEFETVVRPLPQVDENNITMISQGPSICIFNKDDPQEVLASWLFAQYLLTNDPQIAYAETEGYVPVTKRAQESEEYQSYLAACGEDNDLHYDIKIKTTELVLEHIDDTFTTSVFNGSASLRDAAGQLIENTCKASRKNNEITDAFIEEQYDKVTSLYRLNQIETTSSSGRKKDLGPLPLTSKLLLAGLAGTWALIGLCVLYLNFVKAKR